MAPVVAVSGASGFIGRHLVEHLAEQGHPVVALARDPQRLPALPGVRAAPHELAAGAPDLRGCDVLIHAAYVKADIATNVAGAERLLEAAAAAGVGHVVFLSSFAARSSPASAYGRQ